MIASPSTTTGSTLTMQPLPLPPNWKWTPIIRKVPLLAKTGATTIKKIKLFEAKYQLLHRIQKGIDFQDGDVYTNTSIWPQQTLQNKDTKCPVHNLLSKFQSNYDYCKSSIGSSVSTRLPVRAMSMRYKVTIPIPPIEIAATDSQQVIDPNDNTSANNSNIKNTNVSKA